MSAELVYDCINLKKLDQHSKTESVVFECWSLDATDGDKMFYLSEREYDYQRIKVTNLPSPNFNAISSQLESKFSSVSKSN